ncbi:hypothetical protein [Rhodococcus sp. B50]|uniref:hypothetical protein n=1 Tax=Rhodococcus sp. B50 TaxID=2682847 RepID=UPI001BD1C6BA|nr:hypothetical protein [Rhodococcus sp. B50]
MTDAHSPVPEATSDEDDLPKPRVGRPRKYATAADRVRAYRERERAKKEAAGTAPPVVESPDDAVSTLTAATTALRSLATNTVEQYAAIAERITTAVDKLTDAEALEAQMTRSAAELAKVKADADAKIVRLREQLAQSLEDRDNADAAVAAVDAELADARAAHTEQMRRLEEAHHAELTRLKDEHAATLQRWKDEFETATAEHARVVGELRTTIVQQDESLASQRRDLADITSQRDRATGEIADVRAELARVEAALEREARARERVDTDLAAERERTSDVRSQLEDSRITAATAQAAETAARERGHELRAELATLRDEINALRAEAKTLQTENVELRAESSSVRAELEAARALEKG